MFNTLLFTLCPNMLSNLRPISHTIHFNPLNKRYHHQPKKKRKLSLQVSNQTMKLNDMMCYSRRTRQTCNRGLRKWKPPPEAKFLHQHSSLDRLEGKTNCPVQIQYIRLVRSYCFFLLNPRRRHISSPDECDLSIWPYSASVWRKANI